MAYRAAEEDTRQGYGEGRIRVPGLIGPRLHVAAITYRDGAVYVISLRKTNDKEVRRYGRERR